MSKRNLYLEAGHTPVFVSQFMYDRLKSMGWNMDPFVVSKPIPVTPEQRRQTWQEFSDWLHKDMSPAEREQYRTEKRTFLGPDL